MSHLYGAIKQKSLCASSLARVTLRLILNAFYQWPKYRSNTFNVS